MRKHLQGLRDGGMGLNVLATADGATIAVGDGPRAVVNLRLSPRIKLEREFKLTFNQYKQSTQQTHFISRVKQTHAQIHLVLPPTLRLEGLLLPPGLHLEKPQLLVPFDLDLVPSSETHFRGLESAPERSPAVGNGQKVMRGLFLVGVLSGAEPNRQPVRGDSVDAKGGRDRVVELGEGGVGCEGEDGVFQVVCCRERAVESVARAFSEGQHRSNCVFTDK